jgi:hypothetical protein
MLLSRCRKKGRIRKSTRQSRGLEKTEMGREYLQTYKTREKTEHSYVRNVERKCKRG